jgi:hypothetical protein
MRIAERRLRRLIRSLIKENVDSNVGKFITKDVDRNVDKFIRSYEPGTRVSDDLFKFFGVKNTTDISSKLDTVVNFKFKYKYSKDSNVRDNIRSGISSFLDKFSKDKDYYNANLLDKHGTIKFDIYNYEDTFKKQKRTYFGVKRFNQLDIGSPEIKNYYYCYVRKFEEGSGELTEDVILDLIAGYEEDGVVVTKEDVKKAYEEMCEEMKNKSQQAKDHESIMFISSNYQTSDHAYENKKRSPFAKRKKEKPDPESEWEMNVVCLCKSSDKDFIEKIFNSK